MRAVEGTAFRIIRTLKEKEEELNDFEKDKALERAKEQIDKEYES